MRNLTALSLFAAITVAQLAAQPRHPADRIETQRAILYFEPAAFSPAERDAFSQLVDRGVADIEDFLSFEPGGEIQFHINSRVKIASARAPRIFLPLSRVKRRSAPYLHETAHVLMAPYSTASTPTWLSEGFASFVESHVSERYGGYDAHVFSRDGNRGVDREAAAFLASERGRAVLPYIAAAGTPPGLTRDRENVAKPYYVLAQSFVKYLANRLGVSTVVKLHAAAENEWRSLTSDTAAGWKSAWLEAIRAAN